MSWRLTPQERRIIERTRREGEELYSSQTPAGRKGQVWKSVLIWIGVIFLFVIAAMLIYYVGTFL